jgi:O-antigen/teichoic acid export membrane protein
LKDAQPVKGVINNIKWNSLGSLASVTIGFLRVAILARYLDSNDFGIVAIVSTILAFTSIFSEVGLNVAVIHKQNTNINQFSTLFWINLIFGIFVYSLLVFSTPYAADIYKEVVLFKVLPLAGIQLLFNSVGKLSQTLLIKDQNFRFLGLVSVACSLTSFFVSMLCVHQNLGVYSLIVGELSQSFLANFFYFIAGRKKLKIGFYFSFSEVKEYLSIGFYNFGSQFLDYVSSRLDIILIGRYFSMSELGYYNLAKELVVRPFFLINSLTNNVFVSSFAKIQDNIPLVREKFLLLVRVVSSISIPVYISIFLFSDFYIHVLYGDQYKSVSIFLKLMIFGGIAQAIESLSGTFRQAFGKTNIGFKWTIIRFILSIFFYTFFLESSISTFTLSRSIFFGFLFFVNWFIAIYPIIQLRISEYLDSIKFNLLSSILIGLPFYFLVGDKEYNLFVTLLFLISYFLIFGIISVSYNSKLYIKIVSNKYPALKFKNYFNYFKNL